MAPGTNDVIVVEESKHKNTLIRASLDKKLTSLCENIRKKEKDSEKAILDLASEIETLKADNTKLLAKIKNANIKSGSLDGVLKAMELNNEETVEDLEIEIKWAEKELLQFKQDDQFLTKLKTHLLRKIDLEEVEYCKLLLDKDDKSEENKILKEKEIEEQKTIISLQKGIEADIALILEKGKNTEQIINFLEENNEVLNRGSSVIRSAEANKCTRDGEEVKIMAETLDQEISELQSVIEDGYSQFSKITERFRA